MHRRGTVKDLIRFNVPAEEIQIGTKKVTVVYRDRGQHVAIEADYCVSTIPMPIFKTLKTNLSPAVMTAARDLKVAPAGKVGWQADRFWERDYQIYGGISWVDGLTDQVWYPSDGFMSPRGTLTGAYMSGKNAEEFNSKTVSERLDLSRQAIERLHPGAGNLLRHGVAVGWNNMQHLRMGWADESDQDFAKNASILAQPQGERLFQAGDQLTWHSGWQEGAILSAKEAVKQIVERAEPG
jgi:monoamine oxidase